MTPAFKFILFLFRALAYCVLTTLFIGLILYLCRVEDWKLLMIVFLLTFSLAFFILYLIFKKIIQILTKKNSFFNRRIAQFFTLLVLTECLWLLMSLTNLYDTKSGVQPVFSVVDLFCLTAMSFLFLLDLIWGYIIPERLQTKL